MSPSSLSTRRWWRRRVPSIALALLAAVFLSRGAQAMIGDKGVRDIETERAGVECDPEAWRSREKEPTLFLMLTSVLRPSTLDLDLDPQKKKSRLRRQPLHGPGGAPTWCRDHPLHGEYRERKKIQKRGKERERRGPQKLTPPVALKKTRIKKTQSTYLDRLISVDEKNYIFSVTLYFHLSWTDLRAPAAVVAATARMNEKSAVGDGGAGCDRPCSGQEMRHELSLCCDTLWLPSLIFRNILEYPQGRMQAYKIRARDNGVVTWRVEVRCRLFLISDRRHLFNSFSFLF